MDVTQEFVANGLRSAHYITNERVETAVFLALALDKPLLIEGPAGAGKTEVAKVLAELLHTELIRLQCYEGLDEARALYEWNYQKQLLRLQADEHQGLHWEELSEHLFSREYLLERPLLRAISSPRKVVLLIDEIDKADEEFEAFLLELLSDFQVTVPELGTIRAREHPVVVLTSNRARELSEALPRGGELRRAKVPVPVAETLDAMRAVVSPGLDDRTRMREAFAPSLIKAEADRESFDEVFARFFGGATGAAREAGRPGPRSRIAA